MAHICLLYRDLEVVSRQNFVSLLQVCSTLSQLEDLVLLFASIVTTYFCCDSLLSFSMITTSRQYFVHSSNSYVANTVSVQLLQVGVATQVFMSRQHLCLGYVATLSCIICNSVATQKVCRDRGLLPPSLTSCCSFVLMLRHDFFMLSIFAVATQFSCRDKTLLCSAYFCVATLRSMSRHRFISSA